MSNTVTVEGSTPTWPKMCSCCYSSAETEYIRQKTVRWDEGGAPVITVSKSTSQLRIPICTRCKKHVSKAENTQAAMVIGCTALFFAVVAAFVIAMSYEHEIAAFLHVRTRYVWVPILAACIVCLFVVGYGMMRYYWLPRFSHFVGDVISEGCSNTDAPVEYVSYSIGLGRYDHRPVRHVLKFSNTLYYNAFVAANYRLIVTKEQNS